MAVQRQRHAPRRSKFKHLSKVCPRGKVARAETRSLTHICRAGHPLTQTQPMPPLTPPPSGLVLRTLQDQQLRSAFTQCQERHDSHHSPLTPTSSGLPMFYTYHHSNPTPAPLVRRVNDRLRGAHRESKRNPAHVPARANCCAAETSRNTSYSGDAGIFGAIASREL